MRRISQTFEFKLIHATKIFLRREEQQMVAKFSSHILDAHIAPGVSTFTVAKIPNMTSHSKESAHWVANFFLNSALNGTFALPMNAYAYNFLRRAQYAFSEHELARESTILFVDGGGQSPTKYAKALFHWEIFSDKLGTRLLSLSRRGMARPLIKMTDRSNNV